jgi:hypothetical protein
MRAFTRYLAYGLTSALVLGDFEFSLNETHGDRSSPMSFSFVSPAEARIGHPLTPYSYAGVARRTTRRTVRRTAYRLSVLPRGCVYGPYYGSYYYNCGGTYYVHSGGVYVQVVIN